MGNRMNSLGSAGVSPASLRPTRRRSYQKCAIFVVAWLLSSMAWAQKPNSDSMTGMEMPGHEPFGATMQEMPGMGNDGSAHAMHSMEDRHLDMGAHMKMTTLRDPQPGDEERARQIGEAARRT